MGGGDRPGIEAAGEGAGERDLAAALDEVGVGAVVAPAVGGAVDVAVAVVDEDAGLEALGGAAGGRGRLEVLDGGGADGDDQLAGGVDRERCACGEN